MANRQCIGVSVVTPTVDKREHRHFLGFLHEVCNLLRAADAADPDYPVIVDRINQTVNKGIRLGYQCCKFEFIPSFAYAEEYPALEGPHREELVFCALVHGSLDSFG
jgi:hypothetical protein